MQLRFCPACGNRLPEAEGIKFCSSCGEKLITFTAGDTVKNDQPVKADLTKGSNEKAAEDFSVVLKTTGDKERLAKKLGEVLRRGKAAIRMAVDMVPCIIIYKSKAPDVKEVVKIFREEKLHYAIVQGDITPDKPLEEIFPGFNELNSGLRVLFRSIPATLWVGETFRLVLPDATLDGNPGVLTVGDKGLYFFRTAGSVGFDWQITSYYDLAKVTYSVGAIEFEHNSGETETLQLISGADLAEIYQVIQDAWSKLPTEIL